MSEPLQIGDLVELVQAVPGRRALRVGLRGRVVLTGLAWGMCSVELGQGASRRLWQLKPHWLRRVEAE